MLTIVFIYQFHRVHKPLVDRHAISNKNIVQVRAGKKLYVEAVEALRKKDRQDEPQFTTKIDGKTSLGPSLLSGFVKFSPDSSGNLARSILSKEVPRKNQETLLELFPII
jgi:hypothetical protein